MKKQNLLISLALLLAAAGRSKATQTENLGLRVLPAPGPVKVDGKADDWDLSGGIFACDDVEGSRERFAVWVHAMYDAKYLYVLAHFIDPTPLNNPGQTAGDYGFQGDSLQLRILTRPDTSQERGEHFTCWRGKDGRDVVVAEHGRKLDGGTTRDAKSQGAQQGFSVDADGKGYVQELALPWSILTTDGAPLKSGESFTMTVEPNFTVGVNGRLSVKDVFKAGVQIDRVFTFMSPLTWGTATLEPAGKVEPKPVRLSDAREFPTRLGPGGLTADWAGLDKVKARPAVTEVPLTVPEDGYVSLVLRDAGGTVVRELLTAEKLTKGPHQIGWDGLTTPNAHVPGEPVPAGNYTWSAIHHAGIGLRLKGWAANSGQSPWDFPAGHGNWGGDHGLPAAVATDADRVYLGWTAAEAGKALLGCDTEGNVRWNNTHGGIGGAGNVAVDAGTVYADNGGTLYRVGSADGAYGTWEGSDSTELKLSDLIPGLTETAEDRVSLAAGGGKLYVASKRLNKMVVADGKTGKLLKAVDVAAPTSVAIAPDGSLLVLSGGTTVLTFTAAGEAPRPVLEGLQNAWAVAADRQGRVYVGLRDPENQVKVFSADGKPAGTVGLQGGRRLTGAWQPEGMRFINSLAVDANGRLWVMEADGAPKRVSVWDVRENRLYKEFFGSSGYGALGGAIDPADPNVVVGQGCEWRLDPKTGRAACVGVITREGMEVSRFAIGPNGKTYLAITSGWAFNIAPLRIYERVGDADYKLRTVISYLDKDGKEVGAAGAGPNQKTAQTVVWADENGDGERQDNEIFSRAEGELRFSGWYMSLTPEMALYAKDQQFKLAGFTSCGAPRYDLGKPTRMPAAGFGSADGRFVLAGGEYGASHAWMTCYDIASGKALWKYPDTFVGVHGSHNATPGELGLIRGSFTPCASVKLPEPVGNVWIIPTNVGEWHLLTESGYYLTGLFQGDPLKVRWPEAAVPGAVLDDVPPGMGGEDFGGSATLARDGKLYLQAGKTAYWDIQVVGLDTVKALGTGEVRISEGDSKRAAALREQDLQAAAAGQSLIVKKGTPAFTGNLSDDFKGARVLEFKKQDDAAVRSAVAWDDGHLYLGWEVKDNTPWVNGAAEAEMMYLGGDTVDFQLGTDPGAVKNRDEAGAGDLRLSIGSFKGSPTAVIYRKVARDKHPHTFSSGVVKEYVMEQVAVVPNARIQVKSGDGRYTVEAAVPLDALDFKPAAGVAYRADLGVTHGDPAGSRTRLRTYWSNQHTGIVDDAVFELKMEPRNWGEIRFE